MKKFLKFNKIIMAILVGAILLAVFQGIVKADDITKKASLTITSYEHANGEEENVELEGAEFTIYLIKDSIDTVNAATEYISSNDVTSFTKVTPKNGTIKFDDLELGRYLVVETDIPKNVVTKVESFLIDLPKTNDNGDGFEYDVTVYPKNITIYGTVTLNVEANDGTKIEGTEWVLKKLNNDKEWNKYDYDGNLVTNQDGQINIQNLEKGQYRLIPVSALDGYIVDQSDYIEFDIDNENINYDFKKVLTKLGIDKYVLLDDGTYGKDKGVFKTDICSWKIESKVEDIVTKMESYDISDRLPHSLEYIQDSVKIYGINKNDEEKELPKETYDLDRLTSDTLNLLFKPKNLSGYKKIIIKYDTSMHQAVGWGEFDNEVHLLYTNCILENGEERTTHRKISVASVHTGCLLVSKVNQDNEPLTGAIFKIATTKENAEQGIFFDTATSDSNGYVIFDGLKYEGSTDYWIVEVQSPTYEEDGQVKYYNLLRKPIKVSVNSTSHEYSKENTTVVVNRKNFVLPMTGGTFSVISIILGLCIILISIIVRKRIKD